MRAKLMFLAGLAAGFVLGTRAGREKYEELVQAARKVRENPTVQEAARVVQEQANELVSGSKATVTDKLGHSEFAATRFGERLLATEQSTRRRVPARRARDVMNSEAECIGEDESVATAAQRMRDLGVGSLPICGADDRLHGVLTDRDIVVKCIAEGRDPAQVRAGDLAQGTVFWVDATADIGEVLRQMEDHRVKRLPVIENHRLVGMISEADLARHLGEHQLAEFVEKVYAPGVSPPGPPFDDDDDDD